MRIVLWLSVVGLIIMTAGSVYGVMECWRRGE